MAGHLLQHVGLTQEGHHQYLLLLHAQPRATVHIPIQMDPARCTTAFTMTGLARGQLRNASLEGIEQISRIAMSLVCNVCPYTHMAQLSTLPVPATCIDSLGISAQTRHVPTSIIAAGDQGGSGACLQSCVVEHDSGT